MDEQTLKALLDKIPGTEAKPCEIRAWSSMLTIRENASLAKGEPMRTMEPPTVDKWVSAEDYDRLLNAHNKLISFFNLIMREADNTKWSLAPWPDAVQEPAKIHSSPTAS
jgi:hypothetical protein